MKKLYEIPELKITVFSVEDVIQDSAALVPISVIGGKPAENYGAQDYKDIFGE